MGIWECEGERKKITASSHGGSQGMEHCIPQAPAYPAGCRKEAFQGLERGQAINVENRLPKASAEAANIMCFKKQTHTPRKKTRLQSTVLVRKVGGPVVLGTQMFPKSML